MSDGPSTSWANWAWQACGEGRLVEVSEVRLQVFGLTARAERAEADRDRLRAALIEERTETLWNAYGTGMERDGRWRHMCMSDGEWLEFECGLDNSQPDHPADVVKAAIPFAAERFVAALTGKEPSHDQCA